MTTTTYPETSPPVTVLTEGLERLQAVLGDFRQLVEMSDALREKIISGRRGAGSATRGTRYERRTAGLPHLGPELISMNSRLRSELALR